MFVSILAVVSPQREEQRLVEEAARPFLLSGSYDPQCCTFPRVSSWMQLSYLFLCNFGVTLPHPSSMNAQSSRSVLPAAFLTLGDWVLLADTRSFTFSSDCKSQFRQFAVKIGSNTYITSWIAHFLLIN